MFYPLIEVLLKGAQAWDIRLRVFYINQTKEVEYGDGEHALLQAMAAMMEKSVQEYRKFIR